MDKLRAQVYFLKVAETQNFTVAAKKLGVPASSVSRRIQALEQELGTTLIHRSTRVVKLTELGEVYLAQIQPAITALENADQMVGKQSQEPSGILRITALPGYGRFCLLPALNNLKQQYPDIILDIELTDQISNLADNEADIAIRATDNLPDRAVAHKLSENKFVLIASPQYLDIHGVPRTPLELQRHKTIHYRGPNGVLVWQMKDSNGWAELQTDPAFICNQGDALVDQAMSGLGIALVPAWGINNELNSGKLIEINLQDIHISITRNDTSGIFLLYHKPKYSIQKIRLAADFLVSQLGSLG
ncbi:MAG: DNA-binding transcriptional LysR family regulator [Arenicella sp.]|jgi:DNA-binding transcriptional LysR family regulator